jgi:Response regulator receiver domain
MNICFLVARKCHARLSGSFPEYYSLVSLASDAPNSPLCAHGNAAFRFRLTANAPEGQKRFPISQKRFSISSGTRHRWKNPGDTTAKFTLFVCGAAHAGLPASLSCDAGPAERPRVLLADDHPAMLALAADALANETLVVGTVGDGCELLAETERRHPDVIVPDIIMP